MASILPVVTALAASDYALVAESPVTEMAKITLADLLASMLPPQSGNSGKFLSTDGTELDWATVDALPSQAGNAGKFLTTNGTVASWASVSGLPSGAIVPYAGVVVPSGFLKCLGQAESRSGYPNLHAALTLTQSAVRTSGSTGLVVGSTDGFTVGMPLEGTGIQSGAVVNYISAPNSLTMSLTATSSGTANVTAYPHGRGNGSTTFNVPDLRGRVPMGMDDMGDGYGGAFRVINLVWPVQLGGAGGFQNHTLTSSESVPHTHTTAIPATNVTAGSPTYVQIIGSPGYWYNPATITSSSAGGSGGVAQPHNNLQPTMALYYIIKT